MDLQRWFLRLMMAILLTSILAPAVEAGTRNRLGVRTGYYFDAGDVFIGGEYVSLTEDWISIPTSNSS